MNTADLQIWLLRRARARLARHRQSLPGRFLGVPGAVVRAQVVEPPAAARGTLVVIPDPPNLIEHHAPVVDRLAQDFRVVCLELPGFGYSQPLPGFDYALAAQVQALASALDQLEVRDAILEMSCLGAFVGIALAQLRPDLVGRLMLQQVPSYPEAQRWAKGADVAGLIATPWLGQLLVQLAARPIARHWYGAALPVDSADATYHRFTEPTLRSLDLGACFSLASAYQALFAGEAPGPCRLDQPVFALWGDADRTHAGTDRSSILRALPGARLETFHGCGHFPGLERPERYHELLLQLADA